MNSFPATNKIMQKTAPIEARLGENIEILERTLIATNFRLLGKYYAIGFGVFTLSIFTLIIFIRLAFKLF